MRQLAVKTAVLKIIPDAMLAFDGEFYYVESGDVVYGGGLSAFAAWNYTLQLLNA